MATLHTLAERFLAGEPVRLPVPEATPERVSAAMQGLITFEKLVPKEHQASWALLLPRASEDPTPDDGIIRRLKETHDRKLFAHVRRGLVRELERHNVVIPEELLTWILTCHELRESCRAHAFSFLATLDDVAPGFDFAKRMEDAEASVNSCLVRVVKYDNDAAGYTTTHTDRNGLTFNLGASAPGFYVERDGLRTVYGDRPGHALVFPGQHFENASNGRVKALRHGSEPAQGTDRCALVFFAYFA